jgi:hypothetical protein
MVLSGPADFRYFSFSGKYCLTPGGLMVKHQSSGHLEKLPAREIHRPFMTEYK